MTTTRPQAAWQMPRPATLDRIGFLARHVAGNPSPDPLQLDELRALCSGPCLDEGFGR
ncbi:hypothetical protein [Streptomyces sp. NPDC047014]|uniref:hypothetical protein n=1 Tax=Streptomyces sp. NPDC047014 TaxID=3155736 RepID=UPI0033CEADFE